MRRVPALIGVAFAFTWVACGKTIDSTDLRTSGVSAEMSAVADGSGQTMVTADLRQGSGSSTHLDLKGSDELVAIAATGQSQKMTKVKPSDIANYYVYRASLAVETGVVVVAFNRGPEDTSAPGSQATLPDPFTLAGVVPGQTVTRARGLTLTWTPVPGGGNMLWTRSGCLSGSGTIPDAGSLSFDDAGLASPTLDDPPRIPLDAATLDAGATRPDGGIASCAAQICLERSGSGLVDPAFGAGGSFVTTQRRCVAFTLVR